MLKVSKKSQYGLRAMVFLAKNYKSKKVISTKKISDNEDIPFDFLEKIILQLEKAKLVKGRRGARGGYMLSKPPQRISASDVVFVLEENQNMAGCALCERKGRCLTKNVWYKVETVLSKTLAQIKLSQLVK